MLSLKRLLKLLYGYKKYYVAAITVAFFTVMFYLLRPIIIRITVDSVIDNKPLDANFIFRFLIDSVGGLAFIKSNLWICGLAVVFTIGMYGICLFIRDKTASFASEGLAKDVKDKLYNHIQCMPYDYHINAKTGDLIQRCTSDVETVRRFLQSQMIAIARISFTVIFSFSVMISQNVKMTLMSFLVTPILFIFTYKFFNSVKKNFKISDEMEGELSTVLQESVSGVRVVRAFGRQKFELDKFMDKNEKLSKLNQKLITLLAFFWSFSDMIIYFQLGIILVYGVFMVSNQEITLGTMIMFMSYGGSLLWPLRQLGRVLSDFGKMQVSLDRLYEILDGKTEEYSPDAKKPSLKGDIVFKHVNFEYEKGKPVLKDVSFEIKNGETVAVLGTTGSGKSTILHLLLRLYDYKLGSIKINNEELCQIDKKWLRENIGIVLQEPFLFSKTIADNIKMAKHDATDDEIVDATTTACAHEFIKDFEKGYETMVGEKGVTLSGGQKQRVAIARTLIKKSSILIFDDSLSAVDTETDQKIRAALREKQKDVTTFIISQRITTLMSADKIIVFEDGKLTDLGTHDELISREGLYSRIWNIQSMLEDDFEKEAI